MTNPSDVLIDRNFVRVDEGLVHYRSAGSRSGATKLPLYVAHAGPGSSRGYSPFMQAMAAAGDRYVMAPDMLGNGDSDPPAREETDIGYYADCARRILDQLGIEKVDFYGSHTGALIGMDLAIHHPDRVGKLVLDGVLIFSAEEKADLIANYAPKIVIDDHGGYMSWVWQFIRDMSLFWPHYRRTPQTRMPNGTSPPDQLYTSVVDVMKALKTYHIAYNAAFSYDVEAALAQVKHPAYLTCSSWDPMHVYLEESSARIPGSTWRLFQAAETMVEKPAAILDFLNS
jgi:pimeloyl-ACP methyl ester carboxylesterase